MLFFQFFFKNLQLFTLFLALFGFSFGNFHFQFVHGGCPLFFLKALSQFLLGICQQFTTILIIKLDQFIECFLSFNEHLFHADNRYWSFFLNWCGSLTTSITSFLIVCLRLLILFNFIYYVTSSVLLLLFSLLILVLNHVRMILLSHTQVLFLDSFNVNGFCCLLNWYFQNFKAFDDFYLLYRGHLAERTVLSTFSCSIKLPLRRLPLRLLLTLICTKLSHGLKSHASALLGGEGSCPCCAGYIGVIC